MNNSPGIITVVVVAIAVLPVVELFLFLPVMSKIHQINVIAQKAIKVLSSKKISDHWKERAIQQYALQLLSVSLLLLFFILVLLVLFVIVFFSLSALTGDSFSSSIQDMVSVKVQLTALIIALVYGVLRKRMKENV